MIIVYRFLTRSFGLLNSTVETCVSYVREILCLPPFVSKEQDNIIPEHATSQWKKTYYRMRKVKMCVQDASKSTDNCGGYGEIKKLNDSQVHYLFLVHIELPNP